MRNSTLKIYEELLEGYPALNSCKKEIFQALNRLLACFQNGNKLLVCGNGGSAADCEHIVGELMKGFRLARRIDEEKQSQIRASYPDDAEIMINSLQQALPVISLVSQTGLMTAFSNDVSAQMLFAQQVLGYGKSGDLLLAISTSGNSANILYAAKMAQLQGLKVIALTGSTGGKLKALSDVDICVPSDCTFKIQEYHLPVYHCLCACVENELFGED